MKIQLTALLAVTALSIAATSARAGHVYGGIIDTNGTPGLQAGDALSFVSNTTGVVVTGPSQGIQTMSLVTTGAQAGLYVTSGISFTALSNGLSFNGSAYRQSSLYAAGGADIRMTIVGITGPEGAEFAFWTDGTGMTDVFMIEDGSFHIHEGDGSLAITDTSLSVGDGVSLTPTGLNNPPTDPYGHIHGRYMVTDTPGDYTVSYMLTDASGKYANSAPFVVTYTAAVPEPGTIALLAGAGIGALVLRRRSQKSA
jgi:hypothetical protein